MPMVIPLQPMYPPEMYPAPPFVSPEQMMMMPPPPPYAADPRMNFPITQATMANYYQMLNNPQMSAPVNNQGLMNYAPQNSPGFTGRDDETAAENYFSHMARRHFLQQQRLNYNHERLLEKYSRLRGPRVAQFRTFGTSALPGRNYDDYLDEMQGDEPQRSSLVGQSRARIGAADDTYRWMGEESFEPLPRGARSLMQHSRDEPMPFVEAEKFEPVKMYQHPVFGPTPAYIRPLFAPRKKRSKAPQASKRKRRTESTESEQELEKKKIISSNDDEDNTEESDRSSFGYVSYRHRKDQHDQLVPVDPFLFNIYTQRSNGSIESYGQSLYVPSQRQQGEQHSNYYDGLSASRSPPRVQTETIDDERPDEVSAASKHRYNKLQLQPNHSNKVQRSPQSRFLVRLPRLITDVST